MRAILYPILASLLLAAPAAAEDPEPPPAPESFAGLVARYEVESLHLRLAGDTGVQRWTDSSGHGHDLVFEGKGLGGLFRTLRVNQKPTVEIRKRGSYSVESPFDLDDYTIFFVYRSRLGERAFIASDLAPDHGIVLHASGKQVLQRAGGVGTAAFPYTVLVPRSDAVRVAALGRDAGRLRAFFDGADVSSGEKAPDGLRVGRMFHLEYSQFVEMDGEGLEFAEMLFYDRFLTGSERAAVTEFLATRYGLARAMRDAEPLAGRLETAQANKARALLSLTTDARVDLNRIDGVVAIPWSAAERADAPLGHAPSPDQTRITCTRDGTPIRVYVRLGLEVEAPGPALRLLLLKNGSDYHSEDAATDRLAAAGPATVELETTIYLDAGDWLEVVTMGVGEPGVVRLDPDGSRLVAEVQER